MKIKVGTRSVRDHLWRDLLAWDSLQADANLVLALPSSFRFRSVRWYVIPPRSGCRSYQLQLSSGFRVLCSGHSENPPPQCTILRRGILPLSSAEALGIGEGFSSHMISGLSRGFSTRRLCFGSGVSTIPASLASGRLAKWRLTVRLKSSGVIGISCVSREAV
jgi:hypothetical protein